MDIETFLSISWFSLLSLALLAVVGFVLVPKIPTDAQRRRAWLGLGLLMTNTVFGLIMQIVSVHLLMSRPTGRVHYHLLNLVSSVVGLALGTAGIALLLTVAAVGVKKHTYGVQPYAPQAGPTSYGAPAGQDSPIGTTQQYQSQPHQPPTDLR